MGSSGVQRGVYDRGFQSPTAATDLVRAEHLVNWRNSHQIANLLRRLGGAPAAPGGPEGEPVIFVTSQPAHAVAKVGEMLEELVVEFQIDPANILVLTGHTALRDRLRADSPVGAARPAL